MQRTERALLQARHTVGAKARLGFVILGLAAAATAVAGGGHGHGHDHDHDRGPTTISGFAGPLPGLTLAPKGHLLVADQSVGIVPIRRGEPGAPIVLPGVTDMSVAADGTIWALTGAGGPPPEGPQNDTGQGLHVIGRGGEPRKIVNLFQFEATYNPHTAAAPNLPDSNPYDVQALGPHHALVADAGGNDLLRIDRSGQVKVLAVFPDEVVSTANIKSLAGCPSPAPFCSLPDAMPAQPVPTSIAIDKKGYIYVGELKGFPAPAGESNIWRISPKANGARCGESPDCVKVFDGGFTSVIDLAFGEDGLLYVTEFDEKSWAAVEIFGTPAGGTINACNLKSRKCTEVKKALPQPTAIAFDKDGALWSTQKALTPDGAEVVRIRTGKRHGHK